MDWNWFFSSLAQSAAAIVGIFGAFIITKILSNQAAYSEKKNRLAELVVIGQKITDDANALAFDWYNNHVADDALEDMEKMLEENADQDADSLYDRLRFSIYERREISIRRIEQYIQARKERKRKEQEARRGLGALMMQSHHLNIPGNMYIRPALEKERNAMDHVAREARHHTRLIGGFLGSIKNNPESSIRWTGC